MSCHLPNLHAQTPRRRVFSFVCGLAYEAEYDDIVGTEYGVFFFFFLFTDWNVCDWGKEAETTAALAAANIDFCQSP